MAGILGESREGRVVLGFGVNVNIPAADLPAETRLPATSLLAASGRPVDRAAARHRQPDRAGESKRSADRPGDRRAGQHRAVQQAVGRGRCPRVQSGAFKTAVIPDGTTSASTRVYDAL